MAVTCPRCAAPNAVGDGFCGTCGASLAGSGASAVEGGAPLAGSGASVADGGAPHPPAGGTAEERPGPHGQQDAAGVRCPACGHDNTPERSFCQSCGTALSGRTKAPAATLAGASIARVLPAVPPAPASTATGRGRAPGQPRGGSRWVAILVALGLLAGAAVVILPSILGGRPETQAGQGTPSPTADLPAAEARLPVVTLEAER